MYRLQYNFAIQMVVGKMYVYPSLGNMSTIDGNDNALNERRRNTAQINTDLLKKADIELFLSLSLFAILSRGTLVKTPTSVKRTESGKYPHDSGNPCLVQDSHLKSYAPNCNQ